MFTKTIFFFLNIFKKLPLLLCLVWREDISDLLTKQTLLIHINICVIICLEYK